MDPAAHVGSHAVEESTMQHPRRQFLGSAAMAMAAAHLDGLGVVEAADRVSRELAAIGRAPQWLNSPRLTAESLRGKVLLVDFWTYTCINWLRTLPHVRAWARTYRQDLVVIGVHTPEFPFEHDLANVQRAVADLSVEHPVVIDNDYAIWRAFRNQYWPALYFVDGRGRVRDHHFGEGEYERSETNIRRLLSEAGAAGTGKPLVPIEANGIEAAADWANLRSPETYLGYERADRFASSGRLEPDRRRAFEVPARLPLNAWALAGEWTIGRHATAVHKANGRIAVRFHARDVHLVMGPARRGVQVRYRVSLDGQAPGSAHGVDVDDSGHGMIVEQRLYQLIRQRGPILDRTFEIELLDGGAEAFAFTFG
jgi:thiol-disulfide isomerase/thioredoxin